MVLKEPSDFDSKFNNGAFVIPMSLSFVPTVFFMENGLSGIELHYLSSSSIQVGFVVRLFDLLVVRLIAYQVIDFE